MEIHNKKQEEASRWVHEFSDLLYSYAVQRINNIHIAKDIMQETFLAAWRNYDTYKGEASVKNWLFVILKSKIIDHYRNAANRLTDELVTRDNTEEFYFDSNDHWATGSYPREWNINHDERIETKEFYAVLGQCKRKLKEIQRVVFTMKYMDGQKSEEICKTLNLSSSNYWVLLHRAKVQLRSCLEMNWFVR